MSNKYKKVARYQSKHCVHGLKSCRTQLRKGKGFEHEFTMTVPAEVDHYSLLVLCEAARRLKLLLVDEAAPISERTWNQLEKTR